MEVVDQRFSVDLDLEAVVGNLQGHILGMLESISNFSSKGSRVLKLVDDKLEALLSPCESDLEELHLVADEFSNQIIGNFTNDSSLDDCVSGEVEDELGVVCVQGSITKSASLRDNFSDDQTIEFSGFTEKSHKTSLWLCFPDGDHSVDRGLLDLQLIDQVVESVFDFVEDSLSKAIDSVLNSLDVRDLASDLI